MKIAISSETTIDVQQDVLDKYDIKTVPFTVLLGDKSGNDGEITPDVIFKYVDETGVLPKTAAVNEYQFDQHFSKLLKEYDAVIHLSLSSTLSSAYGNAVRVAKNLKNVFVIDTKSLSTGIALLAIHARELANLGLSPEEIVKKVEARIPYVQASFVLNTTKYLHKGGRCSSLARFGSMLLRIKPQILVKDGNMIPGKKFSGKSKNVVPDYVDLSLEQFNKPDLTRCFVTHSHAAPEIINDAVRKMKERGFKEVLISVANSTIVSHCGPKCLGVLFINDGK
ncbi:MAG: DegV family protein [Bacilli bacterium]|nr:DegV family protein [Bacilli bacterium]